MKTLRVLPLLPLLTTIALWVGWAWYPTQVTEPTTRQLLSQLHDHPRLLLNDERISELRSLYTTDDRLRSFITTLLESADDLLSKNWQPKYKKFPPQFTILKTSRQMVEEIQTLGFAWRWTKNTNYFEAAKAKLISVCKFPDWNSIRFLSTAEMTYAVGIGYDWFFQELTQNERHRIEECLIAKALGQEKQIQQVFSHPSKRLNNWNVVTNAGLVVGSLAIAESHPDYAVRFLQQAQQTLPNALKRASPGGSWGEGFVYAGYLSRYLARLLSATETSLSLKLGVTDIPGVKRMPEFIIRSTGPSGFIFNYADAGTKRRLAHPFLLYFGAKYGKPAYTNDEHSFLESRSNQLSSVISPEHVIWYQARTDRTDDIQPASSVFKSTDVTVAFLTENSKNPDAIWLAAKAGSTLIPHGQADQGQFVLDALGERWVIDLGADNYGLPGYWDAGSPTGKRWSYLRLGSAGHNVPTLGGYHQVFDGKGEIKNCNFEKARHVCKIDLTQAYPHLDLKNFDYQRTVEIKNNRASVADCFNGHGDLPIVWKFFTDADASIGPEGLVTLRKGNKVFYAQIRSPNKALTLPRIDSPESNPLEFPFNEIKRISLDVVLQLNSCVNVFFASDKNLL